MSQQVIKRHKKIAKRELEQEILKVQLSISTTESEKFVDELEKLCENFSIGKDYFFTFK